jgi:hypothetical protein
MLRHIIAMLTFFSILPDAGEAGTALSGTRGPSQPADTAVVDTTTRPPFGRFRTMGGIVGIAVKEDLSPRIPFINLDYRWSLATRIGWYDIVPGVALEIGTNLCLPYVKIGPELWLNGVWLGIGTGLTIYPITYDGITTPLPTGVLGGAAGGYVEVGGMEWEVEIGVDGVYDVRGVFPHVAVGMIFR